MDKSRLETFCGVFVMNVLTRCIWEGWKSYFVVAKPQAKGVYMSHVLDILFDFVLCVVFSVDIIARYKLFNAIYGLCKILINADRTPRDSNK